MDKLTALSKGASFTLSNGKHITAQEVAACNKSTAPIMLPLTVQDAWTILDVMAGEQGVSNDKKRWISERLLKLVEEVVEDRRKNLPGA